MPSSGNFLHLSIHFKTGMEKIVLKLERTGCQDHEQDRFFFFEPQSAMRTPLREMRKRSCTNTDRDARNLHHLPVTEGVGPLGPKPSHPTASTVIH